MAKLIFLLFTTIHLHGQNGIAFTYNCQNTIVYLSSTGCKIHFSNTVIQSKIRQKLYTDKSISN